MRTAAISRKTTETEISLQLNIDGQGRYAVDTDCGFINHMLELFTRHGRFDLKIDAAGVSWVDDHHLVEDLGIALGAAFRKALGEKKGICRYGDMTLPMDEALVMVVLDISGRVSVNLDYQVKDTVGRFDTELVDEFLKGFSRHLGLTLHVRQLAGENTHHIIEAIFKGLGRALAKACAVDEKAPQKVPSTKGVL